MSGPVLYSTNPYYAIEVARRYRKNVFYAWCSEVFSSKQQAGHAPGSGIAASSDPLTIYDQLHRAVESEDRHDAKIKSYKSTFKRLADTWYDKGEISLEDRDEIKGQCKQPSWRLWRPLLFVIPRAPVDTAGRLSLVPPQRRAGPGNEFIIADLQAPEFNIIELPRLS